MPPPATFLVNLPFKHRRPEFVRGVAQSFAFELQTQQSTHESEIWSKPDGDGGYWLIRLDVMGHGTGKVLPPKPLKPGEKPRPNYFYSERPHYHKNWVESQRLLEKYCETYVPQAWIYADSGEVLCQAGDAATLHPDKKARLQHILR